MRNVYSFIPRAALGRGLALTTALLLTLGACSPKSTPQTAAAAAECKGRAFAEIGGPISLVDSQGAVVTENDFKGAPSLVFFGFTHCPDICPFAMTTVGEALGLLAERGAQVQPILISVDPERDTPAVMAQYIESDGFPTNLVGLTGTADQVRAAAKAFKADFTKEADPGGSEPYRIGHTSLLYLMSPDWKLATFFRDGTTPEEMATCIGSHLDQFEKAK